jgi:hypothetical protein
MTRRWSLVLSMFVGFCGGALTAHLSPGVARAQEPQRAEKVISAQRFVLVNPDGKPKGIFGFDKNGNPGIMLFDSAGNVTWSTSPRVIH